MPEQSLADAIRSFTSERGYRAATVDRWLHLEPSDATALLQLARELRLGENQLRALWDWAEEIGRRDGLSLTIVLDLDPVVAARRRAVGRNDVLKGVKAALRRLRFPQLAAVEDRLAELVHQLDLPPTIQITFPEFLEGDDVRVDIVVSSAAGLRAAVASLQAAATAPLCDEIFGLLGQAP